MTTNKILWKKWILKYSIGELFGIGIAAAIARFLFVSFPQDSTVPTSVFTVLILIIAGVSEGLIIGYIQWRSFSKLISDLNPLLWIFVTTFSTLAGWLFILPPGIMFIAFLAQVSLISTTNSILYTILVGMAFGGLIGIPQFFIVKQYFKNAAVWIVSNTVSWMLSFLIIYTALLAFKFTTNFIQDLLLMTLACVTSGFIQGLITGFSLHFLMEVREVGPE